MWGKVRLMKNAVRVFVCAAMATWLLPSPAVAQVAETPAATRSVDQAGGRIDIDNFGKINENYYRGAQPEGQDYADLAAAGVKTLINLTSHDADEDEQSMADRAGLQYFQIPMTTRVAPTNAELAQFLKIVNDPVNLPVYVHCVGGKHRTGVMTAIYRMIEDAWTPEQAFKEMKQFKFGADFLHPEFKKFVFGAGAEFARAASNATKPNGLVQRQ
jgi:protein tyrosine/serine phosphatase